MKIQELFLKPVERPIEGVIKASDDRYLQTEVEEFVITREIAKGLDQFLERYLEDKNANGVWISGFFGSGKSHLLKILSLVLDSRPLASGDHPSQLILPKLVDDETLRGALQRATQIPARSVLFNVDQKADQIGGDSTAPILEVFVKVLNELQGYHGKQGHIAKFEHDLHRAGELAAFKKTYQTTNGREWEQDRDALTTVRKKAFGNAYAKHFNVAEAEAYRVLDQVRTDYKVSIESFAQDVKEYITAQGPDFRLNFFVDEVGQFIGQDSKLMLNLQTVAESLATICDGRSWIFVTSQGDLQKVLGDLKKEQGDDFTKIQGRFKTRPNLTSADVREVIQKRLLAKTEAEPEVLTTIYDREKENLVTLYRFTDDSVQYKGWRGSDEFCAYYPFHPYHFDLFQRSIEQLSRHDAFTGKHTSVGERSMLEVFQSVAKGMRLDPVGGIATFDRMFDGISSTIRGDMQTSLLSAASHLDDPLAIRILKALFLLKWVREFKSTPRNVAVLLIDRPDIDIAAHEKAVKQALGILVSQSYLQLNGDCYEFLTDTEKDIEVEIKNTDLDETQVTKLLSDVLFSDILSMPKVRYEANSQDYTYARKLDDQLTGKDSEIALNIITPEHPNHGDEPTLAAQSTGKPELLFHLPSDLRLLDEVRLYLKTNKYYQQNMGAGIDPTRKVILEERAKQNSVRRTHLKTRCADLFSKATVFLNGSKVESVSYAEPQTRFHKLAQDLISFAFPSLKMLKGRYDETTLSKALLDSDDLLTSGQHPLSESEQEILTYVQRNQNTGERTSVEEMLRQLSRRPYGWYPMAVLTLLGRLFRMGKLELRTTEPLDAKTALEHLKNTRLHGSLRVRLQEQFDATKINALKIFHREFFNRENTGTEARSAGQLTSEALIAESKEVTLLLGQSNLYPFLSALKPTADWLAKLSEKDYTYLLNQLTEYADDLVDAKTDLLDPIKTFMRGPQRAAYDEAVSFLREEDVNFAELPSEEIKPLQALSAAPAPYRGNVVPVAKAAVTQLRQRIAELLTAERAQADSVLTEHEQKLRSLPDFAKLNRSAELTVLLKSNEARNAIASARVLTAIRDRLSRYRSLDYPAQLELTAQLATPPPEPPKAGEKPAAVPAPPAPSYIPATSLKAKCSLPYLTTEAEIDQWIAALRQAALDELAKGHRISL